MVRNGERKESYMHLFSNAFEWLKSRTVQIILLITLYLLSARFLPDIAHNFLFTMTFVIKDFLMWFVPLIVCFFVAQTLSEFRGFALLLIVFLVIFETLSNLSSALYALGCAHLSLPFMPKFSMVPSFVSLDPLWTFPFVRPKVWSAGYGSLLGVVLGSVCAFSRWAMLKKITLLGKVLSERFLKNVLGPLTPFFVLGFVARFYQEDILDRIISHYSKVILMITIFIFAYLLLIFFIGAKFNAKNTLKNFKQMLPAGTLGFATGCSLTTMPWTIICLKKILKNPRIAQAIIPLTTNIQQVGDCFAMNFLIFLIYSQFYGQPPDALLWSQFLFVFVLSRFATTAMLGGAIFLTTHLCEEYLAFQPEMTAILLMMNMLIDPIVTSSNVMGNGGLCCIFENAWIKIASTLRKKKNNAGYPFEPQGQ
jgi:Na+/H+-dicarboxylate symporter